MRPEPVDELRTGLSKGALTSSKARSSDFVAFLNLWDYLRDSQKELSGNGFRRRCREEFLHLLRVREWQDLHTQLKQICREIGLQRNDAPAGPAQVHTAALAGLLSHVGLADLRAEPSRPAAAAAGRPCGSTSAPAAPGSRSARAPAWPRLGPPLVVAAEITETTRLWARTVAPITAEQVEEVGQHLLTRQYSEPHWSARAGAVMAYEQVSLYGVPIVARRRVGVRLDRPGRGAGDLHPLGAGRGPVADPSPVLPGQRRAAGRGRGPGGTDPASRPGGRRRDDHGLLRRPDPGRRHLGGALRRLVEAGSTGSIPTCSR